MRIQSLPFAIALLAICLLSESLALAQVVPPASGTIAVTFQLNDAFVRDRNLSGVAIEVRRFGVELPVVTGVTDHSGRLEARIEPGTYEISYALAGYIPIEASSTELDTNSQIVTTSLSPMLEAQAGVEPNPDGAMPIQRIQIVLNWGSDESQVRDADSHLTCACSTTAHVYFANKEHSQNGHSASLDVDDIDWGGPETITLTNPPPGQHRYWVHDYSGPPAILGDSDIRVRVWFDNTLAGEFLAPEGYSQRDWYPFAWIEVGADGSARIEPASEHENLGKQVSVGLASGEERTGCLSGCATGPVAKRPPLAVLVVLLALGVSVRRRPLV